jgi:hypothetical protein
MAHLEPVRVTVGVDTHKHVHVAAARDQLGRRLGVTIAPATTAGYGELLAWARGLGEVQAWGWRARAATAPGWSASWPPLASGSWRSTAPTGRPAGGAARATQLTPTPPPGRCRRERRTASPRRRTARWR